MAWEIIGVGPRTWIGDTDDNGDRSYKIKFRVGSDDPRDGPAAAMQTAGLPVPGAIWSYGNDVDPEAWCRNSIKLSKPSEIAEGTPISQFDVEFSFSTKVESESKNESCESGSIKDPLLQPNKVKGSFSKYTEEASYDRFGLPIVSSSWEQLRGSQNEWDKNRPQVVIEQNVAVLGLDVFAPMIDTLNDALLWGLPARCIKLSDVQWERLYYGLCYRYYKRTLTFDVNYNTFDRDLLDEGTKCLRGHWETDPSSPLYKQYLVDPSLNPATAYLNPANFQRFKDFNGENARVILNGKGRPYDPGDSGTGTGEDTTVGSIHVEKYTESNFLVLGIPLTF